MIIHEGCQEWVYGKNDHFKRWKLLTVSEANLEKCNLEND